MKKSKLFMIIWVIFITTFTAIKIKEQSQVMENHVSWTIPITTRYTTDEIILTSNDLIYNEQHEDITINHEYFIREERKHRVYTLKEGTYRVVLHHKD